MLAAITGDEVAKHILSFRYMPFSTQKASGDAADHLLDGLLLLKTHHLSLLVSQLCYPRATKYEIPCSTPYPLHREIVTQCFLLLGISGQHTLSNNKYIYILYYTCVCVVLILFQSIYIRCLKLQSLFRISFGSSMIFHLPSLPHFTRPPQMHSCHCPAQ